MTVTGKTTVAGIIGWPVSHSLSPPMHNAGFAACNLDWVYVPFPVAPDALPQGIAGLRALGVAGFSVTIPHKVAILPFLDAIDPAAELIGAVNTVLVRDGVMTGYNTDGVGLLAALREKLGFEAKGRSVLVLGAGGAARSAVVSLGLAGAARVDIANRSVESGIRLALSVWEKIPGTTFSAHPLDRLAEPEYLAGFDLVVNTTSVGMAGDAFAGLDLAHLSQGACVYDMVYAPPETPLLSEARRLGFRCANGLAMLAAQGEAAFAIWTGTPPPKGCLEAALGAHLPNRANS